MLTLAARSTETGAAFGVALLAASALLFALVLVWRRRNNPAGRERRRRLEVNRHGRLISGVAIDILDETDPDTGEPQRLISYTYAVSGVDFSACQDVTALAGIVGDDPRLVVGPITVKAHQRNPCNSIVVCEEWSGLRGAMRD